MKNFGIGTYNLKNNKKAFTLVEVMVALVLACIISLFVYTMVMTSYSSYNRLSSATKDSDGLRYFIENISNSMKDAEAVYFSNEKGLFIVRPFVRPINEGDPVWGSPLRSYHMVERYYFIEKPDKLFASNKDIPRKNLKDHFILTSNKTDFNSKDLSDSKVKEILQPAVLVKEQIRFCGNATRSYYVVTCEPVEHSLYANFQIDFMSGNIKAIVVNVDETGVYTRLNLGIVYNEYLDSKNIKRENGIVIETDTTEVKTKYQRYSFSAKNSRGSIY